jgi:uncharacterized protein
LSSTAEKNGVAESARRLEDLIRSFGKVVVAFSGGVDSAVVMKAAANALGPQALGITAKTESNTGEDLEICLAMAREHDFHHEVIHYSELDIDNYAENNPNRCYFCKSELYDRLIAFASERGYQIVCDGSNADDLGDYRPGLRAVAERGVRSPLKENGLNKEAVRALAKHYRLPVHDRPSSPCLSSRIPYGMRVTREKLDQIAEAERILRTLGLKEFRCRHHGDVARLELHPAEFEVVLAQRDQLVRQFREIGFRWVALDLAGFKSGGLNVVLEQVSKETR